MSSFPLPGDSLNKSITSGWAVQPQQQQQGGASSSSSSPRSGPRSALGTSGRTGSSGGARRSKTFSLNSVVSSAVENSVASSGTSTPVTRESRAQSPMPFADELTSGASTVNGTKRTMNNETVGDQPPRSTEAVSQLQDDKISPAGAAVDSNQPQQPLTKRSRSSRQQPSATSSRASNLAPRSSGPNGTSTSSDRASLLTKYPPPDNARLSNLGGLETQITQLLEIVALPLLHPEIYQFTGIKPPRGVLLHGVPGGGKTRLVTCLAGELRLPFISIAAPSLVSSLSGDTEKLLRQTFEDAKTLAPCILFLDEVDAITPKRETAQREMEKRIVGQLLTCMDELSNHPEPVIILAATNRPDSLDPALRRAGRFDHEIEMGVPSVEGREEILKVLCSTLRLSGGVDFHALAMATPGYVGADLTALTGAAGVVAVKRIFNQFGDIEKGVSPSELIQQQTQQWQAQDQGVDVEEGQAHQASIHEIPEEDSMMVIDSEPVTFLNGEEFALTQPANDTHDMEHAAAGKLAPTAAVEASTTSSLASFNVPFSSLPHIVQQSPIASFLLNHPTALSNEQLAPIHIIPSDFIAALKMVQPSAKREGFATVPDVTWADIGALHGIRDELHMAIVQPIRRPELFKMVGIDAPSGVLLWGPPGCGKTLLAKAVANESRANFISVKGPELLNKYVGESERAVRQVFVRARASSPCVIFFDELDALVPRRDDSMSESSARVVNTLLTELDGLDSRKAVYVIGATNRPDMIDPAMVRPGRLDKLLYVDLPTPSERVEILKTHLQKTPLQPESWDQVAEIVKSDKCEGFSGADLAALVREASTLALRGALEAAGAFENDEDRGDEFGMSQAPPDQQRPAIFVTVDHFAKAAVKTMPSVSREQKRKYEALRNKFAGLPVKANKKWLDAHPEEGPKTSETKEGAGAVAA